MQRGIDYTIYGNEMQFIEIGLDSQRSIVAEAGSLMMMDDGIEMETIFGDGSETNSGFMDRLWGAGRRLITGESLFMTQFTYQGAGKRNVYFAAPYPGEIVPINLSEFGGKVICQKDAFLCAAQGVSIGIEFQRRLGVGFFGGEGFIMQKLEGNGVAFVHAGGNICEKELSPGEKVRIDTGCLVAMTQQVDYDIEYVGNVKTALFGGEGIFFATLQGPGKVWIQSLPLSRLASRVFAASPQGGGKSVDEGSVLGRFGNMFER